MGYGAGRGCSGRSSCRWRCPRSWPACGSPRSPPSRWSPSGVLVGHGGLGPADHRRLQRQLLPGRDRHRRRRLRAAGAGRRPAAGRRRAAADPVGAGGAVVNALLRRARLPQRPVQLDPAERHPRPARPSTCAISVVAVLAAMVVGAPARRRARAPPAAAAGRSSCCPTSAAPSRRWPCSPLFAVTPIGFGDRATTIALAVFAIPPILTNTYVGFRGVDADVREAARAMGMSRRQVIAPGRAAAGAAAGHDRHPDGGGAGGRHRDAGRAGRRRRARAGSSASASASRTTALMHRRRHPGRRAGGAHRAAAGRRRPGRVTPGPRRLPVAGPPVGAPVGRRRSRRPPASRSEQAPVTERSRSRTTDCICARPRELHGRAAGVLPPDTRGGRRAARDTEGGAVMQRACIRYHRSTRARGRALHRGLRGVGLLRHRRRAARAAAAASGDACAPVAGDKLVVLEDDKDLQNADNVIPAVNAAAAQAQPGAARRR